MSLFIHYSIITQNDHFKYLWGKYHSLLEIAKIIKVSYNIGAGLLGPAGLVIPDTPPFTPLKRGYHIIFGMYVKLEVSASIWHGNFVSGIFL